MILATQQQRTTRKQRSLSVACTKIQMQIHWTKSTWEPFSLPTNRKRTPLLVMPGTFIYAEPFTKPLAFYMLMWRTILHCPPQLMARDGLKNEEGDLIPVMMSKAPMSEAIEDNITCNCQTDCTKKICKCRKRGIVCTQLCHKKLKYSQEFCLNLQHNREEEEEEGSWTCWFGLILSILRIHMITYLEAKISSIAKYNIKV